MSMKMGHGMKALLKTSIAIIRGCTDMREAHFHIKHILPLYNASRKKPARGEFSAHARSILAYLIAILADHMSCLSVNKYLCSKKALSLNYRQTY